MKHVRMLCVCVGLLAAGAGCQQGLTKEQAMWLADGEAAYEHEQFTRAVTDLTRFLNHVDPDRPEIGRALLVRGMSHAQTGSRQAAYADLRSCVATSASDESVWKSYIVLGTLAFEDRQWNEAVITLRAAANRMPPRPPYDWVLYRLGLSLERIGRWDLARLRYREIADRFASGSYAESARRKLARNADHYAVQAGVFGVRENADAQLAALRSANLPAYIRNEIHHHAPRHVVLVGPYPTYAEALTQLGVVREHVSDAILWP